MKNKREMKKEEKKCDCIQKIRDDIRGHVGVSVYPQNLDLISNRLFITFSPMGKHRKDKEVNVYMTHCPFCGKEIF
jgi:hypothetical protein